MSPLWPYAVSTQLQLDSGCPIHLNLRDPNPRASGDSETVKSAVIWDSRPLPNRAHTLLVSKIPGDSFAIVDGIIYTVQDPPVVVPPPPPPPPPPPLPPPQLTTEMTAFSTVSTTSSTVSTTTSSTASMTMSSTVAMVTSSTI
ncbi:hypothetical protein P691DRAFT_768623 [Macrolepiota fuliginosa MF-IS2]|uniref:Uncharacterized protein n=1 Tax=Macrolepiota fuliginosa MF-IS2 TaxID=1400762 RepID=A0A9P5WW38_9AGAR|nr:hypothetical protein P691DRAFT_768623 [Macrolepiota fuliginosa MF-IS2]